VVGTPNHGYTHDEIPSRTLSQDIICSHCQRKNRVGSLFCDICGKILEPTCKNCGNSKNLPNSSFCNKCGAKIDKGSQDKNYQSANNNSRYQNDKNSIDFTECLSIKHRLKFRYPLIFTKVERIKNDPNNIFAFQQIDKKSAVEYPPEITISVRNLEFDIRDLQQNSEEIIKGIISMFSDAALTSCFSSKVGNAPAYQFIITFAKKKEIFLFCVFKSRLYTFRFSVDYRNYINSLYQFEEFKNSIEFLV
jgi:hypothetical protein